MRTTTTQEDAQLALKRRTVHARVYVDDSGGTPVEVTSLAGRNWLSGFSVRRSVDDRVPVADVVLHQRHGSWNFSPLMSSPLSDLCVENRDVKIEVMVVGRGLDTSHGTWREIFFGRIDQVDWDGETVKLVCADDKARTLRNTFIETERTYGAASPGDDAENVIQDILDDNLTSAPTLRTPTSPSWQIVDDPPFILGKQHLWDAVRLVSEQIGWDLISRWYNATADWELVFEAPDRLKTSPDVTFAASQYFMSRRCTSAETEIRNSILISYPDASTTDNQGRREYASVTEADMGTAAKAVALASQTAYGVKHMEITLETSSAIDNQAEAIDLAEAAIYDLAEPELDMEVVVPLHWPLQLRDLVRLMADDINFDSDQDLAVDQLEHVFDASGFALTRMVVSGKPKLGRKRWLQREARTGLGRALPDLTPDTPVVTVTAFANAADLDLGPVTQRYWEEAEIHCSASSGFTPDASTILAHGKLSQIRLPLEPGAVCYIKARYRDRFGNWSGYSSEESVQIGPYSCRAEQTSQQTVTTGAAGTREATLEWDVVEESGRQGSSDFDTANERFTAGRDGLYFFRCKVTQDATAADTLTDFVLKLESDDVAGTPTTYDGGESATTDLAPGDSLRIGIFLRLDQGDDVYLNASWSNEGDLETSGDSDTYFEGTEEAPGIGRT